MRRPEDATQIALVDYLRRCGLFVFHVKNQGAWSVQYGRKLNRMGRLAGMPDLQVLTPITPQLPRGVVMIEVKAPPKRLANGKLSKAKPQVSAEQEAVIETLGALGVPTLIVRSVDEAEAALRALGVPLRGKVL